MNLLAILLGLALNVYCKGNLIHVEYTFLFGHNFWEAYQKLLEDDKGYLYDVKIKMQDREKYLFDFNWFNNLYFFDETNKLNYIRIIEKDVEDIVYFMKSKEDGKAYLRFEYFYTDRPFNKVYRFGIDENQVQWYKNFKILGSTDKSTIEIFNDEHDSTIMHHVDERFGGLFAKDLIMLNDKIFKGCLNDFSEEPNFELFYFKNYSDCLEGIKIFLDSLQHLTLIDDTVDSVPFNFSEDSYQKTNTLKLSSFMNYLNSKFEKNFENIFLEPHEKQYFKSFYHATCEYVKYEILCNRMILPLGGLFTIDYHLEKLYASIIESISKTQQNCISLIQHRTGNSNLQNMPMQDSDEKPEKTILQDLYDHKNILKYFSNLFNREIITSEDYVELEKVVCDYYNMVKYLSSMLNIQCLRNNKGYTKPIYTDNYKCRIIEGIDILFIDTSEKGTIKAFDSKGEEVLIVKGIDYFNNLKSSIFISFENIANKGIKEIEVISAKYEFIKRFSIEKNVIGQQKYILI